jgi:Ran GTPase-activating protein (RanGAP) involved in mRNA processing and transport
MSLKMLNLSRKNMKDEGAATLAGELQQYTSLTTLDLSFNVIGSNGATLLADKLQHLKALTTLVFTNNFFTTGAITLVGKLQRCDALTTLDLSYNGLEDIGVMELARNVRLVQSLTTLNLGGNGIGGIIAAVLVNCTVLKNLVLSDNEIGDTDAPALACNLQHCKALTTIDLSSNRIADTGASALARYLQHGKALTTIDLSSNRIADTGASALARNLQHCKALTTIDLSSNRIADSGVTEFALAIASHSNIVRTNISNNMNVTPETQARFEMAVDPVLRKLVLLPSEPPLLSPVCVVGFQNVGKTALVRAWSRRDGTTAHAAVGVDAAAAVPGDPDMDDRTNKTAGVNIVSLTLRGEINTAPVNAVDFAGHVEYYLSHEMLLRCYAGAVFVLLFRLDRCCTSQVQSEEVRRLFYWLKFIATMRRDSSGYLPKVFLAGTHFDGLAHGDAKRSAKEWGNSLLLAARSRFKGVLDLSQRRIFYTNCADCNDSELVKLTDQVAQACECERTDDRRKAPHVCSLARVSAIKLRENVVDRVVDYERELKRYMTAECKGDLEAQPPAPPSWTSTLAPVMSMRKFASRLEFDVDGERRDLDLDCALGKCLLRVVLSYLHNSGDILFFDNDSALDGVVIVAPSLFCSKVIGALFLPSGLKGFDVSAAIMAGTTDDPTPTSELGDIAAQLKISCGIDEHSTRQALRVLEQLELCHRVSARDTEDSMDEDSMDGSQGHHYYEDYEEPTGAAEVFMFPGAIAAGTGRPEGIMDWKRGRHFCAGRQFELSEQGRDTLIFKPALLPAVQCWALNKHPSTTIWASGLYIGFGARGTRAYGCEVAAQLHCHAATRKRDIARGTVPGDHMLVVIARSAVGGDRFACGALFSDLCNEVRRAAGLGTALQEMWLPPAAIAEQVSPLDLVDRGYCPIVDDNGAADEGQLVCVWAEMHKMKVLREGDFVEPIDTAAVRFPLEWAAGPADMRLVEVDKQSAEFAKIRDNMKRSMPEAADSIHRIDRVQNRSLWVRYASTRSSIAKQVRDNKRLDPGVSDEIAAKEILAWHSTGWKASPDVIINSIDGFMTNKNATEVEFGVDGKPKFYNYHNKAYGDGAYFCEHSIYGDTLRAHTRPSDAENGDAGKRQMLVAKVVLGTCFDHGSSIPRRRPACNTDGFHSRQGTEEDMKWLKKRSIDAFGNSKYKWRANHPIQQMFDRGAEFGRQYVVHRSSQAYPAYVVTYTNPNYLEGKYPWQP